MRISLEVRETLPAPETESAVAVMEWGSHRFAVLVGASGSWASAANRYTAYVRLAPDLAPLLVVDAAMWDGTRRVWQTGAPLYRLLEAGQVTTAELWVTAAGSVERERLGGPYLARVLALFCDAWRHFVASGHSQPR